MGCGNTPAQQGTPGKSPHLPAERARHSWLTTVKELSGDRQGEVGVACLLVGQVSAELSRRGWGEFANLEGAMELSFCFWNRERKQMRGNIKITGCLCCFLSHGICVSRTEGVSVSLLLPPFWNCWPYIASMEPTRWKRSSSLGWSCSNGLFTGWCLQTNCASS